MPLVPGMKLGEYELLAFIGAGGMGDVYRARDTKLGREVAIKVLRDPLGHDPERLGRFQREARLLASLNHPNIATLHELAVSDGVSFLVMEMVEGCTLSERIARGRIRVEEAFPLFIQMAEALEEAHRKGIVHRDLKPSNVKLTLKGRVKVLDFGLAKVLRNEAGETGELSQLPTRPPRTDSAVILGTAPYMSPEHLRGKEQDTRTDVWGFGCVLYEALTGKVAFLGPTVADTLAAIMEREPDWSALPREVPPLARSLLRRCLQKDPDRRLHDIADARLEIEEALGEARAPPEAPSGQLRKARPWLPVLLLSVLTLGLVVGMLNRYTLRSQPVLRLAVPCPLEAHVPMAISPDGNLLVYGAGAPGPLFVRAMDEIEGKPIPGTNSGPAPFFSPDGRWVGFSAEGKLKKVRLSGGAPVTLSEGVGFYLGGTWGPNDRIVFAPKNHSGLWEIPASGGTPREITSPDRSRGEKSHRYPHFLSDGDALLFTAGSTRLTSWDDARIELLNLKTRERRLLIEGGQGAVYSPTGHIVYARSGSILAAPFDPKRLTVTGPSVAVVDGVRTNSFGAFPRFALSRSGTLVYAPGSPRTRSRLVRVDRKGNASPIVELDLPVDEMRLSPDGRFLAMSAGAANDQIWCLDLERGALSQVTFEWDNVAPIWTPDGKWIIGMSSEWGWRLFRVRADGSGPRERLADPDGVQSPGSVSPDGKYLLFVRQTDVWVLSIDNQSKPAPFVQDSGSQDRPTFSPDGRWVSYESDESGRLEVYLRSFPEGRQKLQLSTDGGSAPVWARNGRELFYRAKAGASRHRMMAVDVIAAEPLRLSKPRLLFEDSYVTQGNTPDYDVMPDGKSFVMVEREAFHTNHINIVLNWFEELKRRVPPN